MHMGRNRMDIDTGRTLVDKTPIDARILIENTPLKKMVMEKQFTTKRNSMVMAKKVNAIQANIHKKMKSQHDELIVLMKKRILC